jgi:hypothetical protein
VPGSDVKNAIVWSLRDNWRPTVLYLVAPALLLPLLGAGIVMTFAMLGGRFDSPAPNSAQIPADERAVAMLEVFVCLRKGAADCPDFDATTTFLTTVTEASFTYTPLTVADPGAAMAGGQHTVRLGDLSSAQLQAVGAAVARGTEPLDASAMTVTAVDGGLQTVTFRLGDLQGTVAFSVQRGTYQLVSITYRKVAGDGG